MVFSAIAAVASAVVSAAVTVGSAFVAAGAAVAGAVGATGVVGGLVAGAVTGGLVGATIGGVVSAVKGENIFKGMLKGGLMGAAFGGALGAANAWAAGSLASTNAAESIGASEMAADGGLMSTQAAAETGMSSAQQGYFGMAANVGEENLMTTVAENAAAGSTTNAGAPTSIMSSVKNQPLVQKFLGNASQPLPSGTSAKGWWDSLSASDKLLAMKFGGDILSSAMAPDEEDLARLKAKLEAEAQRSTPTDQATIPKFSATKRNADYENIVSQFTPSIFSSIYPENTSDNTYRVPSLAQYKNPVTQAAPVAAAKPQQAANPNASLLKQTA